MEHPIRVRLMRTRWMILAMAQIDMRVAIRHAQWGESFFKHLCFAIVIVFWLKWAGYLPVAGMNLLPLISDRVSPGSL